MFMHPGTLDSTGHVYMTDPAQQEAEIDFFARHDAERERFAGSEEIVNDDYTQADYDEMCHGTVELGLATLEAHQWFANLSVVHLEVVTEDDCPF